MTTYAIRYNNEWQRQYRWKNIYNELQGDHTGDYWITRKSPGISQSSIMDIDWEAYHRSTKAPSFGKNCSL